MPEINLLDVAKFYNGSEHQKIAIAYLQGAIPADVLGKFAELWRSQSVGITPTLRINKKGIALIMGWEGFRGDAYVDPVGVWTIGYGHTKGVKSGDRITEPEAYRLLIEELHHYEQGVRELVSVALTSNQFSALVSFAYNVGLGGFKNSTMRRKLNAQDYVGAAEEFGKWIKGGSRILPGLVRRRQAEKQLFNTKD